MKIFAWAAAGLIAASALAPVPAEAQRYGYNDRGHRGGWNDGHRRDRHYRGHRGWRGDRGYRGGRSWRGRDRVRCVWVRGYYGPQRQCFRR